MRLILTSTSPRRKELLALLGRPFEMCAPSFIERLDSRRPAEEQAREFAFKKADSCSPSFPEDLLVGSDTIIALDNEAIGKPRDQADAESLLRRLMGREHRIWTAVAVVCARRGIRDIATETVRVRMARWDDRRVAAYVRTGEGMGKAGAYSIQGAAGDLIERIDGDFTAAVGLPLRRLASMLAARGLAPLVDTDMLYRTRPYPNWNRFGS